MANEPLGERLYLRPPLDPIVLPPESYLEYRDRVANEVSQFQTAFRRWRGRSLNLRTRNPFNWRRPLRGIYPQIPDLNPLFPAHAPQNWRHRLGTRIAEARRAGRAARSANQRRSLTAYLALRNAGRATGAQGLIPPEIENHIASFL